MITTQAKPRQERRILPIQILHQEPDLRNGYDFRSEEGFCLLQSTLSPETMSTIFQDTPQLNPRKGLLECTTQEVSSWLRSYTGHDSSIIWLSGLVDSSSLHEVIALCKSAQQLVAIFSFSSRKGDQQRQEIFPSLAYQIAMNIPVLRPAIGFAVFQDPQVLSKRLDIQMRSLLLSPFDELASADLCPARPVVIIDGIELYHDQIEQEMIISQIELAVTSSRLPLRFIFASRSRDYTPPFHSATHIRIDNSVARTLHHDSVLAKPPSTQITASSVSTSRGFPQFVQTQYSIGGAESYTRSLMMLGHGVPLWCPQGSLSRPLVHMETGVRIGDVLTLDAEGNYDILLNIFCDENDSIQQNTIPGYFKPIYPPLSPSEVKYKNSYFKPGTVITSPGVTVTTVSTSPLHVHMESNSLEGAVLVLPDGASREDLVSTHRFREYVKKWAPYWYRTALGINGSLFLVTGCDKTSDYAALSFPSRPSCKKPSRRIEMDYIGSQRRGFNPWRYVGDVQETWHRPLAYQSLIGTKWPEGSQHLCVFVRGMHIALGESTWSGAIGLAFRDERRSYTTVLHKTPSLDRATTSVLARLHRRLSEPTALKELPLTRKQLFHPIFFLAPALLRKYPSAGVVLVDDAIWCSLVNKQEGGSLDALNNLVDAVLENTTIVNQDGMIYLSMKADASRIIPSPTSSLGPSNRRHDRWGTLVPISQYAAARLGRPSRPVLM